MKLLKESLLIQSIYFIRIFIAAVCGAAIGYEREAHLKAAGIRTHTIVALSSCLMMIISKYGFFDVVIHNSISLDPSRIAAGIVTAIGFLGAGTIFVNKQSISGLTTAAGIWATVGVGMTIGTGFYFLGLLTTFILLIIQIVLHKNLKWLKIPSTEKIIIQAENNSDAIIFLEERLKESHIKIVTIQATKIDNHSIELRLHVKFPETFQLSDILNLLKENPHIKSIDI